MLRYALTIKHNAISREGKIETLHPGVKGRFPWLSDNEALHLTKMMQVTAGNCDRGQVWLTFCAQEPRVRFPVSSLVCESKPEIALEAHSQANAREIMDNRARDEFSGTHPAPFGSLQGITP